MEPSDPQTDNLQKKSIETLIDGLSQPIVTGWRLAFRAGGRTALMTLPFAVPMALLFLLLYRPEGLVGVVGNLALLALFASGVALVGLSLSRQYSGTVRQRFFADVALRFVPYVLTWILMVIFVFIGTLFFIIPGIYFSLRLFWADEYALTEGANPVQAIDRSWKVTKGWTGAIFRFQFFMGIASFLMAIPAMVLFLGLGFLLKDFGIEPERNLLFVTFTICLFYVFYSFVHGPELVYFHGLHAYKKRESLETHDGDSQDSQGTGDPDPSVVV